MKALFSRLTVAALICVVQSQLRGYSQSSKQMDQASRRRHRAEEMSGREALAIAMGMLKRVNEFLEETQWAELSKDPDLSVTLPAHEQVDTNAYSSPERVRAHPWIVLQFPTKRPPKDKPTNHFDQLIDLNPLISPLVPRPVPPPKTAKQRPPFPRGRRI